MWVLSFMLLNNIYSGRVWDFNITVWAWITFWLWLDKNKITALYILPAKLQFLFFIFPQEELVWLCLVPFLIGPSLLLYSIWVHSIAKYFFIKIKWNQNTAEKRLSWRREHHLKPFISKQLQQSYACIYILNQHFITAVVAWQSRACKKTYLTVFMQHLFVTVDTNWSVFAHSFWLIWPLKAMIY